MIKATILALGDSTTAGTPGFQSPAETPPDGAGDVESQYAYWLMRVHPEWRVLNRGVNGERSDQIRSRFERDIRDLAFDLVVVIAGVNDVYQNRSAEDVQHELETIFNIAAARAAPLRVVAGTILPFNTATAEQNQRMIAVNRWIEDYVHHRQHMAFCDTRAACASPEDPNRLAASPDDLHPSPDGYRLVAIALEPAIRRLLAARP